MKKNFTARDIDILLTYQWASIEHVFPNLRLVSVTLENNPEIYFYVHGKIPYKALTKLFKSMHQLQLKIFRENAFMLEEKKNA
jgi:hypothetical protein